MQNLFGTVRSPVKPVAVSTRNELIERVQAAAKNKGHVRVIGSGWSWNRGILPAGPGPENIVIRLAGGEFTEIKLNDDGTAVTAGAGALVCDMNKRLVAHDPPLQLNAMGLCLSYTQSQTIGGVLATNVHHSGTLTFAQAASSVDVLLVDRDGECKIVTTRHGEPLYQTVTGSAGVVGIIVSVTLPTRPLRYYDVYETFPLRGSLAAEVEKFVAHYDRKPMDGSDITSFNLTTTSARYTTAIERKEGPRPGERVRRFDASRKTEGCEKCFNSAAWKCTVCCCADPYKWSLLLENQTTACCYGLCGCCKGKPPVFAAQALTSHAIVSLAHEEIEFHVPVASAKAFAEYLTELRVTVTVHMVTTFRFSRDDAGQGIVHFNFDSFVPKDFERMRHQLRQLDGDKLLQWGIKVHVGKGWYVPQKVVDASFPPSQVQEEYDPLQVFRVAPEKHDQ